LQIGDNVKNLVILIPNERHHGPGEDNEARFIDQSFVPEIAVVGPGTNVFWFNGDGGHEHDIVCPPPYGKDESSSAEFSPITIFINQMVYE
jgi:hypothetical protein